MMQHANVMAAVLVITSANRSVALPALSFGNSTPNRRNDDAG